jgi:hypothetical protein
MFLKKNKANCFYWNKVYTVMIINSTNINKYRLRFIYLVHVNHNHMTWRLVIINGLNNSLTSTTLCVNIVVHFSPYSLKAVKANRNVHGKRDRLFSCIWSIIIEFLWVFFWWRKPECLENTTDVFYKITSIHITTL